VEVLREQFKELKASVDYLAQSNPNAGVLLLLDGNQAVDD
jgi:hypothetical protein